MQLAILHIEAVATLVTAVRDKHPFCADIGYIDLGGDAMGAVNYVDRGVAWHGLGARKKDAATRGSEAIGLGSMMRVDPRESMGNTLYLPASTYQSEIISISLSRC
jgi:hypothetical protein